MPLTERQLKVRDDLYQLAKEFVVDGADSIEITDYLQTIPISVFEE